MLHTWRKKRRKKRITCSRLMASDAAVKHDIIATLPTESAYSPSARVSTVLVKQKYDTLGLRCSGSGAPPLVRAGSLVR